MDRAPILWIVLSYHGSRGRPSPSGLASGRWHGCVRDTSACSISSNGKATILATTPGNSRPSLKMHLISSKHSTRNTHVVLSLRSPHNVLRRCRRCCQFMSSSVFVCLRLSSSMFLLLSYLAVLLFFLFLFSSETSLSRRGGIVRTRHGWRSVVLIGKLD